VFTHKVDKIPSGCAIAGIIDRRGEKIEGQTIVNAISAMEERSTNLGAGFAGYGIYPDCADLTAFHVMFEFRRALEETRDFLKQRFFVQLEEAIPTTKVKFITNPPMLRRFFARPRADVMLDEAIATEEEFVRQAVISINEKIDGAFVFSSGKNLGVFKGVGFPCDIAEFYRLAQYKAHLWIAHGRFPTNTPGWWGGAHPFNMLNWSIVHNGEVSSYGINKRYLESFGYKCTLRTDTEVLAYLLDLLIRVHGLPTDVATMAMAAPFWKDIDRMEPERRELVKAARMIYGGALVNGPFSIIVGYDRGMFGLNDRIKLRPMVAAVKGPFTYIASEECAIREVCPDPERVWSPRGGEPVIAELESTVAETKG